MTHLGYLVLVAGAIWFVIATAAATAQEKAVQIACVVYAVIAFFAAFQHYLSTGFQVFMGVFALALFGLVMVVFGK